MGNQTTEWKRQWRDGFLKAICGLANAQGGTFEIGRDAKGAVVGIDNRNPEKFVFGAFVKVGYFENGADLVYQDNFHGSLMAVADQIVDTAYRKYFKGIISYKGILRVTDNPVPLPALREAIFNAIVHRDYTTGIPIQIKVFPDCVVVYNDGRLPEYWTIDNLLKKHRSRPYNPKIAYGFYRAGFIETWVRGIERITTACSKAGKREPVFEASPSEVSVTFFINAGTGKNVGKSTGENIGEKETRSKILQLMRSSPAITAKAIAAEIDLAQWNVEAHIRSMKKAGLVKRVGAAKGGYWLVKRRRR